jgi:hypothetical protein
MSKLIISCLFLVLIIASCTKSNYYEDNKPKVIPISQKDTCNNSIKYSVQINRILKNSCTTSGCHDGVGSNGAGLNFKDYQTVFDNKDKVMERINNSSNPMPPSDLLIDCDRQKISTWIKNGALDN